MRLNAAIALRGLTNENVDVIAEQIRCLLHEIDPNIDHVGVDVQAVGAEFGGPRLVENSFQHLLAQAEHLRRDLLNEFWLTGDRALLYASLRVSQTMGSMNRGRIQGALDTAYNH
jgi:hypothetical protein